MTNKKRRQLEEEERRRAEAAERQAADARQGSVPTYYGAVNFGEVNGYALPVTKGQVQGIQLPPIIQPISLTFTPFMPTGFENVNRAEEEEDYDDFDGDDWF